jgi:hypothetical protein
MLMKTQRILHFLPLIVCCLTMASNAQAAGVVRGKVTVKDQTLHTKLVSTTAQSNAANSEPFGQEDAAQNVIVYVEPSAPGNTAPTTKPMSIAQEGCHFTEAIRRLGFVPVAPYTGQLVNRNNEEIIPVKCGLKSEERKYFVVLKTTHYSVTAENGTFSLNDLAPGKYIITAWDETYGSQSQEVTITGSEIVPANFVFKLNSKT